jgi:hypothetical protein
MERRRALSPVPQRESRERRSETSSLVPLLFISSALTRSWCLWPPQPSVAAPAELPAVVPHDQEVRPVVLRSASGSLDQALRDPHRVLESRQGHVVAGATGGGPAPGQEQGTRDRSGDLHTNRVMPVAKLVACGTQGTTGAGGPSRHICGLQGRMAAQTGVDAPRDVGARRAPVRDSCNGTVRSQGQGEQRGHHLSSHPPSPFRS